MEKNTGKVREFCQLGKVGTLSKKFMIAGTKYRRNILIHKTFGANIL